MCSAPDRPHGPCKTVQRKCLPRSRPAVGQSPRTTVPGFTPSVLPTGRALAGIRSPHRGAGTAPSGLLKPGTALFVPIAALVPNPDRLIAPICLASRENPSRRNTDSAVRLPLGPSAPTLPLEGLPAPSAWPRKACSPLAQGSDPTSPHPAVSFPKGDAEAPISACSVPVLPVLPFSEVKERRVA